MTTIKFKVISAEFFPIQGCVIYVSGTNVTIGPKKIKRKTIWGVGAMKKKKKLVRATYNLFFLGAMILQLLDAEIAGVVNEIILSRIRHGIMLFKAPQVLLQTIKYIIAVYNLKISQLKSITFEMSTLLTYLQSLYVMGIWDEYQKILNTTRK